MTRVALFALLLGTGGCFGAPWASPPIRASIGIGSRVYQRARPAPRTHQLSNTNVALRATLEPLQIFPTLHDRPFDVGVGWLYEPGADDGVSVYGPFVENAWVLYSGSRHRPRASFRWGRALRPFHGRRPCGLGVTCTRVSLRTRVASVRSRDDLGTGVQLAAQLSVEYGGFARWLDGGTSGDGDAGVAAGGAAYGETMIGLYAELVRTELPDTHWWQLSGGVAVRVPASVGGFFAVCPKCAESIAAAAILR